MEAFLVSAGIVALAEMGDKTQVATVALAARYASIAAAIFALLGALALADREFL